MVLQMIRLDSIRVIDTSTDFRDTYKFGSSLNKELTGPISDITETLYNKAFASNALRDSQFLGHFGIIQQLPGTIENTKPSRFSSSTDTTLPFEFSRCDCISINISMTIIGLIGRFHPTHLSFTGSEIRARHVDGCSQRVFLWKTNGISTSDSLQLFNRVVFRVYFYATFCTAVREVDDWTLDRHETGQGFNFLEVNVLSVSCSTFCWEFMSFMLASESKNSFNLSVFWFNQWVPLTNGILHLTTLSGFL